MKLYHVSPQQGLEQNQYLYAMGNQPPSKALNQQPPYVARTVTGPMRVALETSDEMSSRNVLWCMLAPALCCGGMGLGRGLRDMPRTSPTVAIPCLCQSVEDKNIGCLSPALSLLLLLLLVVLVSLLFPPCGGKDELRRRE